MVATADVRRPIRREDQDARRLGVQCQRREQIDGRRVAPVKVVEPQDQRTLGGERHGGVAQLAHHPLAIRAPAAHAQTLALRRRQQRRHVRDPRRRVPAEHGDDAIGAGAVAHHAERLQDRKIRLTGSVVLDALPPPAAELVASGGTTQELRTRVVLPIPGSPRPTPSVGSRTTPRRGAHRAAELARPSDEPRRGRVGRP
jgi:hypothetical protein